MATTIRILAYCKGLQKNGVKTEVFTLNGTTVDTTEPLDGIVECIPYHKSYLKPGDGCQRIIDWILFFLKKVDKLSLWQSIVKD